MLKASTWSVSGANRCPLLLKALEDRSVMAHEIASAEITGVSSMATRHLLGDVGTAFAREAACGVAIRAMGGVDAARLVRQGTPLDVIVLASDVMERLEREGFIRAGSRVDIARSGMVAAVPAGLARPDLADEAAVRRAMLAADRVAYSSGPSGDHLLRLWGGWGIAQDMASRAVQALPGVPVGTLLARGEADLGFQQLSEFLNLPGIDIVGPLPPVIQLTTVFTAGVGTAAPRAAEARAFLAFLASPSADGARSRRGLQAA